MSNSITQIIRRRTARVVAACIAALALCTVSISSAGATVNTWSAPYKSVWLQSAPDCTAVVGYHYRADHLATGGATLTCTKRHSSAGTLYLKRNGVVVAAASSGTFSSAFGWGSRELITPTYNGAGGAYWQVVLSLTVDGVPYTITTGSPDYWVNGT